MESVTDKGTKRWLAWMNFGARMGCHQIAERSFFYKGYQFPVCARCTGMVIGEIVSVITILCTVRIHWLCALLLVLPLAVDGGLQYIKIWQSNNVRRVITGILAGFGLTYVYYYVLAYAVGFAMKLI